MIWLGAAVAVVAVLSLVVARHRHRSSTGRTVDAVDPLFTAGIILTGAGVAIAATLGGFTSGVMIVGLVFMALGANRTRRPHH